MKDDSGAPKSESGPRPTGRQPYEKPAVTWEQPLESQPSLMSGCQKTPGGGPDCTAVGPTSS